LGNKKRFWLVGFGVELELPSDSKTRDEAAQAVARALAGCFVGSTTPSPFVGGRRAGLQKLRVFNAQSYATTRNAVGENSGVSKLSPYIRHGCITLTEAKVQVVSQLGVAHSVKWIQELAWRQFWQLLYTRDGEKIYENYEEAKVPLGRDGSLPCDIAEAQTGLRCMDRSLEQLYTTGYMHNHARMWVASYFIHHRKLDWRVGAQLFYAFLLDGDPASNTLSWQWIASTFSSKPYFFNRENVEKFSREQNSGETLCTGCPAAKTKSCPFDASYEALEMRLFGTQQRRQQGSYRR
jgi:deoxyribodipyrimidine photo-lyase